MFLSISLLHSYKVTCTETAFPLIQRRQFSWPLFFAPNLHSELLLRPEVLPMQRYFPGAAGVPMSLIKMEKAITKVEQKGLVREGGWRNMSRLF